MQSADGRAAASAACAEAAILRTMAVHGSSPPILHGVFETLRTLLETEPLPLPEEEAAEPRRAEAKPLAPVRALSTKAGLRPSKKSSSGLGMRPRPPDGRPDGLSGLNPAEALSFSPAATAASLTQAGRVARAAVAAGVVPCVMAASRLAGPADTELSVVGFGLLHALSCVSSEAAMAMGAEGVVEFALDTMSASQEVASPRPPPPLPASLQGPGC